MTKEEEIYSKYLKILKAKLILKYDELGLRASGDYAKELQEEITESKMIMYGINYSQYMENGRNPGKFPPIKSIERWIEVKKGLPAIFLEKKKQFAFIIARKIAKEGIKVPNENNQGKVISIVVEDFLGNDIHDMIEEFGQLWLPRITSDVLQIFRQVA